MHPDASRLMSYADGELPSVERASIRQHLIACTTCGAMVEEGERTRDEIDVLLRAVDHPHPAVSAASLVRRAQREGTGRTRAFRRAAGFVLAVVAAGVAYAAPGSPLREWIRGPERAPAAATPSPVQARRPIPRRITAGIAVTAGESLIIQFAASQQTGVVRITLVDSATVVVRAPESAATFSSAEGRLLIDNAGSTASFEIELPRAAPSIEVRVGDRRLLMSRRGQLSGAVEAGASSVVLSLSPGH